MDVSITRAPQRSPALLAVAATRDSGRYARSHPVISHRHPREPCPGRGSGRGTAPTCQRGADGKQRGSVLSAVPAHGHRVRTRMDRRLPGTGSTPRGSRTDDSWDFILFCIKRLVNIKKKNCKFSVIYALIYLMILLPGGTDSSHFIK